MGDPLLDAVFTRMERASQAGMRIGTVTAVDTTDGSVTVDMAGEAVPGVRWVGSYSPVAGDVVVVSRVGAMWVVLGRLSKQLGAPAVTYHQTTFLAQDAGYVVRWSDGSYGWGGAYDTYYQGRGPSNLGQGTVLIYPNLSSILPDGATVTGAKLRLTRVANYEGSSGAALVSPRLHTHNINLATATGAPVWAAGPWSPGSMAISDSAVWDLPSGWVTAWLAGSIRGLGLWSTALGDLAILGGSPGRQTGQITVSYTTPA